MVSLEAMRRFVGFDCGGTSTRALVVDESGNRLWEGRSGPGNLASTPGDEILEHLREAVSGLAVLGGEVAGCAGCFAGLLTGDDRRRGMSYLEEVLGEVLAGGLGRLGVFPDYEAVLAAESGVDGVLIAGTGTLVASRLGGVVFKTAGGGPLLGDEGSAFDIGRRALRWAFLGGEVRVTSPFFEEALVEQFGTSLGDEVVAAVYRSVSPASRVAKLAPAVVFDAGRGVGYAVEALEGALGRLAESVGSHARGRFGGRESVEWALAGGLWETDEGLVGRLQARIDAWVLEWGGPHIVLRRAESEPVTGAVRLAMELGS